jgi:hypothetical protein
MSSLVSGIVNDMQDLIKQQLRLTRQEIEADLQKTKEVALLLAVGWIFSFIGGFAICLMLAHLIHAMGAPAGTDPSSLPLWASFAIVASLFILVGGIIVLAAKKKIDTSGGPLEETAKSLEEISEWKTKAKPS